MKKIFMWLMVLVLTPLFAQQTSSSLRVGYFNPQVTDGGFIVGYQWQRYIDENFDVGMGIDWFRKTYTDEKLINDVKGQYGSSGAIGDLSEVFGQTNLHDFPIMFNINVNFPLENKMRVFGEGGLGLDFLFIYYRSYPNLDEDNLKVAVDFSWRLGAGIMYPLGRRSEVLFSLDYHSSEPSWDYEMTINGKKHIFVRKYDMSGIMARIGFRFFY